MSLQGLLTWIGSLTEPREATNGLPTCPYAKDACDNGKVEIVFNYQFRGLIDLNRIISRWSDRFDVVLVIVRKADVTPDEANAIVGAVNHSAGKRDLVVMVDHPDRPFVVDGHNNSNGEFVIFFVQVKSKLDAASEKLKARGYYRNWPSE